VSQILPNKRLQLLSGNGTNGGVIRNKRGRLSLHLKKYPMMRWIIETITRRYGVKDFAQLIEKIQEFNIEEDLDKINCATLSLVGEGEGDEAIGQTRNFFEDVSGPRAMHIFTFDEGADSHCQISNLALMNTVVFDWLDDLLFKADKSGSNPTMQNR
jgi:hypothetical protein